MASRLRGLAFFVQVLIGVVLAAPAGAQPTGAPGQRIHSFLTPGGVERTGLVVGRDGWVYGMRDGDGGGGGTIFRIQASGADFQVIHEFTGGSDGAGPSGTLVEGTTGIFYGTTTSGGANGGGTLFQLDTTASPALVSPLYAFAPGAAPNGAPYNGVMLASDGWLYGTAGSPGVIYKVRTDGTGYLPIHEFIGGSDPSDPGQDPQGVVEGRDGFLYGTTFSGPDTLRGRVFRMQRDGSQFEVLTVDGLGNTDAPGQIISPPVLMDDLPGEWVYVLTGIGPPDPADPTAPFGAPDGTVFRLRRSGGYSEVVHEFTAYTYAVGAPPTGRLVRGAGDAVFGLTGYEAANCDIGLGCGGLVRARAGSGAYPVHVFQSANGGGVTPKGSIARSPDGRFFVLTASGGEHGEGSIYVVDSADAAPLAVTGPTAAVAGAQVTYTFSVANTNGWTLSLYPFDVVVRPSPGLSLVSESAGSGWACVLDPFNPQYTCNWPDMVPPGSETTAHAMTFGTGAPPYSIECGTTAGPCVSVTALIPAFGGEGTVTTQVTITHPDTLAPNLPPVAADDSAFAFDTSDVTIEVLENDTNPAGEENDVLTLTGIVDPPRQGDVLFDADGTVIYTPRAPLTGPDTFRYRVTDPYGASAFATVTVSPGTITLSKSRIDLGLMAPGRIAGGRTLLTGPDGVTGYITLETVPASEIPAALAGTGYDPALAVSNPDDFRVWEWVANSVGYIWFRAPAVPGTVSVVRAQFRPFSPQGTPVASLIVVGASADPAPPLAVDDAYPVPNTQPSVLPVLDNDAGPNGFPLYVSAWGCLTPPLFGLPCPTGGGGVSSDLSTVTYLPAPGFNGTAVFEYTASETECGGQSTCFYESNMYVARATLTVDDGAGNTPTGSNVSVSLPPTPITVTFSAVTTAGETTATPLAAAPPLPSGFEIAGTAYDISTTAQFTPPVTVCFDGTFGASDVLLHFEGGVWVALPNQQRLPVIDPPFTRVCADTMTLSPFAVATRVNRPPTAEAGPDQIVEATSAAGALVTVTGTASDPDADALTYSWSGACGTAAGTTATLTCPLGASVVTLSVSDGWNPVVTDTLTITVRDTTPPAVSCGTASPTWSPVNQSVSCTATDAVGMAAANASFTLETTVPDGTETSTAETGTRQVCDDAGNCATAGPVGPFRIDRRGPAIALTTPANGASYAIGQAVTARFACTDGGSGVQSCAGTLADGATVPTDTPGTFTFTVDARDEVGNPSQVRVTYTVRTQTFTFTGFFWPVQNPPVVNKVKAGSAIPVRFSLGGNHGLDIFAEGFPQVVQVACGTGLPEGEVQETAAALKSGLIYNPFTKRYIYVWKTDKGMAGSCWQLTLRFTDGTSASALFKMRR